LNDQIIGGTEQELNFYALTMYNEDTFDLAPGVSDNMYAIADIYFRISTDQFNHVRSVENVIDFLGNVAGITDLLQQILIFIVGSYSVFFSNLNMIKALYKFTDQGKDINFKMRYREKIALFLQSSWGCKCCVTSKSKKYLKMLEMGEE
jgi:hypothetical protein